MSDIRTLAKAAGELIKAFNKRLRAACAEMPVTSFEAVMADGEPVITLISEYIEVDEEQLEKEKLDDPKTELKVGDTVPETAPIEIQVIRIGTAGPGAGYAEQHTENINERADGAVEEVRYISGIVTDWMRDRNDFDAAGKEIVSTPRHVKYEREAVYAVIAYLAAEEEISVEEEAEVGAGKKKS